MALSPKLEIFSFHGVVNCYMKLCQMQLHFVVSNYINPIKCCLHMPHLESLDTPDLISLRLWRAHDIMPHLSLVIE